jgi:lysine decarboxylase
VKKKQINTPFFSKLKEYADNKEIVCLDVPGHKMGRIQNELIEYVGQNVFRLDSNAPRGLDNLSHPTTILKEAAELMSDAFKSENSYFLTNGTTLGILSMIITCLRSREKIILPRNCHKSAINALILSGAIPIFIYPKIDQQLGISLQPTLNDYKEAIENNPDATAIFIINPSYYGVSCDIVNIIALAHENNMVAMVDEAHGSHLVFNDKLPFSAMEAGADIAACSLHKTAGSFTQSSILLTQGYRVDSIKLRSTINMLQSTSPSSLLLASLDVARKTIVQHGQKRLGEIIEFAALARKEINKIPGLFSPTKQYFLDAGYNYDETKIIISCSGLGITGFQLYRELKDSFNIQLELGEVSIVLAILSIGSTKEDVNNLIYALRKMSEMHLGHEDSTYEPVQSIIEYPKMQLRPRDAYHGAYKYIMMNDSLNEIAAESIMIYPPGIPLVIPGEVISQEIIDALYYYQKNESVILKDTEGELIKVIDQEKLKKEVSQENEES